MCDDPFLQSGLQWWFMEDCGKQTSAISLSLVLFMNLFFDASVFSVCVP